MAELPYQSLLDSLDNSQQQLNNYYSTITAIFKTWINDQTRLNAANMNELVSFIRNYSQQVGNSVSDLSNETLANLISLIAGWKVSANSADGTVIGGELFNDYVNNSAEGQFSHAGGTQTSTSGQCSFAHGTGLNTASANQVAFGSYNNNLSTNVFEIGNGTSSTETNNLFYITQDGKAAGSVDTLLTTDPITMLTPKGYVDTQIDLLDKNVWLGYLDINSETYNNEEQLSTALTNAVKQFTVDTNPSEGRDPRNGDQITINITDKIETDPQFPEVWMYRNPDPKTDEDDPTPGKWVFFSSIQPLLNASTTVKGLVQIGTNINVEEGVISLYNGSTTNKGIVQIGENISVTDAGLISVPSANSTTLGVVKLGANIVNDENNNLSFIWNTW